MHHTLRNLIKALSSGIFCLTMNQPTWALPDGYYVEPGTEVARPRSTVDSTRTDRLVGNPYGSSSPLNCPSGQVYSGGACVVIPNQSSGVRSWTSYFLGQRKGDYRINDDGSITTLDGHTFPTPIGNSTVYDNTDRPTCWNHEIKPVFTNAEALTGSAPSNWSVIPTSWKCG